MFCAYAEALKVPITGSFLVTKKKTIDKAKKKCFNTFANVKIVCKSGLVNIP